MSKNKKIGQRGEDIACFWLKNKGFKIKERNYNALPYGEIDIIAEKGSYLIFFEVKAGYRPTADFRPEIRINKDKKESLKKACEVYLSRNNIPLDSSWQIDILAVEINSDKKAKIRHFENAVKC